MSLKPTTETAADIRITCTSRRIVSAEEKEALFQLISDELEFVDATKDLSCCSCGLVALLHNVSSCNHLYCRDCFQLFREKRRRCKQCKAVLGTQSSQNKAIESAILKLKVNCLNLENGCEEDITLEDILPHLNKCQFIEPIEQTHTKGSAGNSKELKKSIEELEKKFGALLDSNRQLVAQNERLIAKNDELAKKQEVIVNELAKKKDQQQGCDQDKDKCSGKFIELNTTLQQLVRDFALLKTHLSKVEVDCEKRHKGNAGIFSGTFHCVEKNVDKWIEAETEFGKEQSHIDWLVNTIKEVTISQKNDSEFFISNANFVFFTKSEHIAFSSGKKFEVVDWMGQSYECLCTLEGRKLTTVITWSEHEDTVIWELSGNGNELTVVGTCPGTPYSLKFHRK